MQEAIFRLYLPGIEVDIFDAANVKRGINKHANVNGLA